MNPKDAGFFKLNVEKIILAGAVLFMLVFAGWFLIGEPFTPEIGNRSVSPDQIENQIASHIYRLDQSLKDTESKLPDRDIPAYSQAFEESLAQSTTTLAVLTPIANPGLDSQWVRDDGPGIEYNLPRPPIAQGILIRKGHSVLSNQVPARELPGFIRLIGDGETRDFNYVSVAAIFDMDEWVLRLQSGEKEKRVPQRWWNGMLGISGVMLQRQELDEATGEWGQAVMVDPLPNQLAFATGYQTKDDNRQAIKETIQLIRANQELIARSEFPQTSGNINWSPPNEDGQELDADGQRKLYRLNGTIKRLQEQITTLEQQMQQARESTQPQGRRPERSRSQRGRGGADRGGAGGAGGYDPGGGGGRSSRTTRSRGTGNRQGDTPQTPQERTRLFNEQLIEAKIERNALLGIESDILSQRGYSSLPQGGDAYGGYGGGYPGGPGGYSKFPGGSGGYGGPGGFGGYPGETGGYGVPGAGQPAEPESRKIKVWAHDLSIEPGKTYRYRLVVAVLNPLHRKPRIAEAQRAENFDKLSLGPDPDELQASPWSESVQVDHRHYFFMVKGSAASARVEVWRVYDGRWIDQEFDVRPGDPIGHATEKQLHGGIQKSLDMSVGLIVVDLVKTSGGAFGGGGVRMLYLDPDSNRIADRTIQSDRNHPDRIRLQNEQALESELALSTLSSTSASP